MKTGLGKEAELHSCGISGDYRYTVLHNLVPTEPIHTEHDGRIGDDVIHEWNKHEYALPMAFYPDDIFSGNCP